MSKFKKIAFLFPGQGAQYAGMGRDFYEAYSIARETFEEADDLLGRKLSSLIFHGPEQTLTETKNSQVAIYVASVALLRVLQHTFPQLKPAICAGLSLGEYTALHASNRIGFTDGLKLVQWRGLLMNDACETTQGGMAVILGLTADQAQEMVNDLALPHDLWAANFNCPGQVVISGTSRGIEAGIAAAKTRGAKRAIPLQVHGAFHSGLMRTAGERLAEHIISSPLKPSSVQFLMNVPGDFVEELDEVRENLIKQVTHPVRWEQGVQRMADADVDLFIEVGCKKTLSEFNKRMKFERSIPTFNVEKVTDLALIERELS
jgi:[acyl-carrier-protein] S-malonyltransferase